MHIFSTNLFLSFPVENFLRPSKSLHELLKTLFGFVLVVAICCGFVVILFLQFESKFVREFVIGKDVKNPSLNIIGRVLGLSQRKLPKANFSRSLLMMFLLS
jgi:hypothetical protein